MVGEWVTSRPSDAERVAATLDTYDVVVIQHEYGIFGGADGMDVLDVVTRLHAPVVTVLHTVLTTPTPNQHRVLAGLVECSAAVVTMTTTARDRLIAGWGVDPSLDLRHPARRSRTTGRWCPPRSATPAHRPRGRPC